MTGRSTGGLPWLAIVAAGAALMGIALLMWNGEGVRREPPVMKGALTTPMGEPTAADGIAALPVGKVELVDSNNTPPALLASLAMTGDGDPMADRVDIDIPVPSPSPDVAAAPESRVPEPEPEAPADSTPPPPSAAAATAPVAGAGGGDSWLIPPVVLKAAWVDYPREARKRKSEGDVEVRILVDIAGGVSSVEIERGAGDESLNQAALAAARSMRFRAARQGDRPVAVWFNYQFSFRLPS